MSDLSPWQEVRAKLADEWYAKAAMGVKDTYVYRYYDAEDNLLYVGQTGDLKRRETAHRNRATWFPLATRKEVQGPCSKALALALEFEFLAEEPTFNRTMRNGHRGPGSFEWEVEAGAVFEEMCRQDPDLRQRQTQHMSRALDALFTSQGLRPLRFGGAA